MESIHEVLQLNVQKKYLKAYKDVRMEKFKSWAVTALGFFAVRCWCFSWVLAELSYLLKTILFGHESLLVSVCLRQMYTLKFFADNFSQQVVKSFTIDSSAGICYGLACIGNEDVHKMVLGVRWNHVLVWTCSSILSFSSLRR